MAHDIATRDDAGRLTLGGAALLDLDFARVATPAYVYDVDGMVRGARELDAAFDGAPHLVAYAVKANTAGPIVRALAAAGCGADVVSVGELEVALACGVAPARILYSGVAKRDDEIDRALTCGPRGIAAVQLESAEELRRVAARAREVGRRARVSIRVNPGVDKAALGTHAHIATGHDEAKFGVPRDEVTALAAEARALEGVDLVGLATHVGSQFTSLEPYVEASRTLFALARDLLAAGAKLEFVDSGGGFGIDYGDGCPVRPADFVRAARREQAAAGLARLDLHVEPGRSLVGAHGVVVASILQTKAAGGRRWAMIDAGMNDLIRPALYQAKHRIVPLAAPREDDLAFRVVGPVCESSDDFGEHVLPAHGKVAILDAGAYGFTMASQYNGRPLPPEVFLQGGRVVAESARGSVDAWVRSRVAM